MSWLTDLAGKAENLLNRIDQNAAVVLKDKNSINEQLQDVIWKSSSVSSTRDAEEPKSDAVGMQVSAPTFVSRTAPCGAASPALRSSPCRSDIAHSKQRDDEDLLHFLNSSEPLLPALEELRGSPSGASLPSGGSSSPVNMIDVSSRGHSRSHSQGGMSSMSSSYVSSVNEEVSFAQSFKPVKSVETTSNIDEANQSCVSVIMAENNLLKSEVHSLNNELTLLLQRTKAAEKEVTLAGQELRNLRETQAKNEELEYKLQELQNHIEESEKLILTLTAENEKFQEKCKIHGAASVNDLAVASDRLRQLESEKERLTQDSNEMVLQISRLQASVTDALHQNERYRQQLSDVTSEAEQYRARATRVLQEKEKLIADLQSVKQSGEGSDFHSMIDQEVEQLRGELNLLRQESASQLNLLQAARNELQICELQQEEQRQKAEVEIDRIQKKLQEERTRRLAAEEESRSHLEECRFIKSEMTKLENYYKENSQAKDAEINQLKKQLTNSNVASQSSIESADLEARVRNLATTLIQKQGALEALIAERNSLRLKVERLELKGATSIGVGVQSIPSNAGTILNMNETENATRLRVPTLLSECPSDTGVTRRVKRAYSSLDTVGIRVGVFLRRYPLARILVIIYVVLLHLWVALVLFSYSPEGNSSRMVNKSTLHDHS